jgi:hypothetical protein
VKTGAGSVVKVDKRYVDLAQAVRILRLNPSPLVVAWAKAGFSVEDIAIDINCRDPGSVLWAADFT